MSTFRFAMPLGLCALALAGCSDIVGVTVGGATFARPGYEAAVESAPASPPQSDVHIVNKDTPECAGIEVVSAQKGLYGGVAVGLFLTIRNTSGQRKWIKTDIKFYSETHTYFENSANEEWEEHGPFIMRADETLLNFPVKALGGPNTPDRIEEVDVLGCGTT